MKIERQLCFFFLFSVITTTSFTQTKWQVIELDDNLTFSFPSSYRTTDTLGQKIFLGSTDFGFLQAGKIPQPQAHITNEEELTEFYIAYQQSTIEQGYGKLISDTTVKSTELYMHRFQFENYFDGSLQVQDNLIVFIDGSLYVFVYANFKNDRIKMFNGSREKATFFSAITITDTDFEDQLTIPNKNVRIGEQIGLVIRYIMLGGLLIAIALWFLKKYEQVKIIKSIFSWTFLLWGAVCIFLYVGNLAYGKTLNFFLAIGLICLIIGLALRKLKVPIGKPKE